MIKEKTGDGKATGKIILMGEHSVVYGEPAIAFPFKETAVLAKITAAEKNTLDCHYFKGSLSEVPSHLNNIKEVVNQTLTLLNHEKTTLNITLTSTIPAERGMGSSAAVAVAIVRGLFDYFDTDCTPEQLLPLVNTAEKIAHGNPSGIDAAATSGNQPIFFVKGQSLEPFPMNLAGTYLIVADTGIKGQTRKAVSDVATLMSNKTVTTTKQIHELGQLTKQAKEAILTNDAIRLGQRMNQAQKLLHALTVSNHQLDQLVTTARNQGALGAKLTGGGRGGCMIALADSKKQAEKIAAALQQTGAAATWIQSLEVKK